MPRDLDSAEFEDEVDWLNPDLKVSVRITEEAFDHLPEITTEDFENKRERYCILAGSSEIISPDEVDVTIDAVAVQPPDDPRYYTEGRNSVRDIQIALIREEMERLRQFDPRYRSLELLGDLHTHPVKTSQLPENLRPWYPSPRDVTSRAEGYQTGLLPPNKPFIFGIGGLLENGATKFAFYRIVREGSQYKFKLVEWK